MANPGPHPLRPGLLAFSIRQRDFIDFGDFVLRIDVPAIVFRPPGDPENLILLCIEGDLDQILQRDVLGSEAVFICPDAGAFSGLPVALTEATSKVNS